MYLVVVLPVKMTFLLCFHRIFATSRAKVRYFIWFGMAANIIFYVIVFFRTVFLCSPVAHAWDPFIEGHCASQLPLPYATGIFGFISDFYIFMIPIPCVWNLDMKAARKAKLLAAFSVGLL